MRVRGAGSDPPGSGRSPHSSGTCGATGLLSREGASGSSPCQSSSYRSTPLPRQSQANTASLLSGVAITLAYLPTHSIEPFMLGTAVAGIGFGLGFQGAVRTVVPAAALLASGLHALKRRSSV